MRNSAKVIAQGYNDRDERASNLRRRWRQRRRTRHPVERVAIEQGGAGAAHQPHAMQSMPSKSDFGPLSDIAHNIALARTFVRGLSFAEFQADPKTVYAVIRSLEIISEASRRLSDDLKARHPEIAWGRMAGAGNVYRHDYLDIREDVLWQTVHEFLEPLMTAVEQELAKLPPER